MNAYPMGQTIDLGPWELRDADGDLVAAADEACTLLHPDGTTTTPTVTATSTGIYTALVTPAQLGLHSYEAILTLSDGSQAVNVGEFYVTATPFDPSPVDLTDLAAVRSFLQTPAGDVAQDAVIGQLITAASTEIERVFAREFHDAGEGVTRQLEIDARQSRIELAPYDLRTATTLRIDADTATPATLTAGTDYRLLPVSKEHGVWSALRLFSLPATAGASSARRVLEITGNWGFPAVPADVRHWCNVTVAEWLRKDVAAFSSVFNLSTDQVDRPAMLPQSVIAGLGHYRRMGH